MLSRPQVLQSSARQAIGLGLDIVTASKRVHDGWVRWLAVAVFLYLPTGREGYILKQCTVLGVTFLVRGRHSGQGVRTRF